MPRRKRREVEPEFQAEMPSTVWPPTVTQRPVAFVQSLRHMWGRGIALIVGAVLMSVGFFVVHGAGGTAMGVLGAVMIAAALLWDRLRR